MQALGMPMVCILMFLNSSNLFSNNLDYCNSCPGVQDYDALMEFYFESGGDVTWSGWGTDCNIENWPGIIVDPISSRVTEISLTGFNHQLSGSISPSIGDLTELRTLELFNQSGLTGHSCGYRFPK